jgi:hypothetical protein
MPDPLTWMILIGTALLGSTIGGIAGFGAGILLLPVAAGRSASGRGPVLTVTMLSATSRASGGAADLPAGDAAFIAGAVRPPRRRHDLRRRLQRVAGPAIGAFLLRRSRCGAFSPAGAARRAAHFPFIGGAIGCSRAGRHHGPVVTPFFLAYGLRRGAFIATEALCAGAMHVTRGLVFARYG